MEEDDTRQKTTQDTDVYVENLEKKTCNNILKTNPG